MRREKSGVYLIECLASGKAYVGSSHTIGGRWYEHRWKLRRGDHPSPHLQHAWSLYGEDAFRFSILEECPREDLVAREQYYIDTIRPAMNSITDIARNYSPEGMAKVSAANRARAALITCCPAGHPYDDANTHVNTSGKRECRMCRNLRTTQARLNETPEKRMARLAQKARNREATKVKRAEYDRKHRRAHLGEDAAKSRAYYERHREEVLKKKREYDLAHKNEKREYSRRRYKVMKEVKKWST